MAGMVIKWFIETSVIPGKFKNIAQVNLSRELDGIQDSKELELDKNYDSEAEAKQAQEKMITNIDMSYKNLKGTELIKAVFLTLKEAEKRLEANN